MSDRMHQITELPQQGSFIWYFNHVGANSQIHYTHAGGRGGRGRVDVQLAVRFTRGATAVGKLPSSLICSDYMYFYIACMIFNRLMSAMSIDGIWQNDLIYFEIRRNVASHFGVRISYPCWLTAFSHQNAKYLDTITSHVCTYIDTLVLR